MAEPTDINKNKSAVDILIDSLRLDLKEAQKFKNIDAAYFGGKAGTSVPVPKKFTAEQTISFMRKFPSTYPLADENAYFGIARALTTESPELFDIASFDAYEKKFGKTMEMQEKGGVASKNITTAKTPKAANVTNNIYETLSAPDKLKIEEFVRLQKTIFPDGNIPTYKEIRGRVVDGTATIRDAFIAKMYNLGIAPNSLFEQLDETSEFAKKFHKAFGKKVVQKAMTMTGHSRQAADLAREVDLSGNFLELQSEALAGTSNLSSNKISKLISPLSSSFQNVKIDKLSNRTSTAGDRKLFKGAIPPEVLETVLKQIAVIREKEGAIAADAVLGSLLGMRGADLTETRTTVELATRTTPQRPVYNPETGTVENPVEEGQAGKGLKPIGDDRPLGPLLAKVFGERFSAAGPTGELFPGMTTGKINSLINKYVTPALSDEVKSKAKKRNTSGKFSLDYTDLRRITASAIANGLGNTEAADAILAHTGSEKELDAKILRTFYIDVEDIGKLEQRGLVFSMFEKMMANALGAETGGQLAASLGYDFADFEADYSDLESKMTMDAPAGTDNRPVAVTPTPEQAAINAELSESRGKLTSAQLEEEAADKEQKALDKQIETAKKRQEAEAAGILRPKGRKSPDPLDEISEEGKNKLRELGASELFGLDDPTPDPDPEPPKGSGGKGTLAVMTGLTGAGIVASDAAIAATAEIARDIGIDTAGEVATRGFLGRVAAGRIPFADFLIPSGSMSPDQEIKPDDRLIQSQEEAERIAEQAIQKVKDEDKARFERAREQQLIARPIPGKSFLDMQP